MEHTWQKDEIFVFGSNLKGIHGAGAAAYAREHCGAQLGVGVGLTGRSYAIPTCKYPGVALPLHLVKTFVDNFILFAECYPELKFFLTKVGCGIAGFSESDIAPLFKNAPTNVRRPPEWY